MMTGEKAASLESLQAEMLELKRSVEKSLEQLQTLIATRNQDASVVPENTDATYISFEDAAKHVRANYSRLLHKLSQ